MGLGLRAKGFYFGRLESTERQSNTLLVLESWDVLMFLVKRNKTGLILQAPQPEFHQCRCVWLETEITKTDVDK